jgi:microcystin-dependent protein
MSEAYISEIRIFGFSFAPRGWAQCNGQMLQISQNQALFSLLGTTYGGNGVQTFALPNLQSRVPMHFGQGPGLSNYSLGQVAGEEAHVLQQTEIPAHVHPLSGTPAQASTNLPVGNFVATSPANPYIDPAHAGSRITLTQTASAGGSQSHANQQPYLVVNFCICLFGIFPSRN